MPLCTTLVAPAMPALERAMRLFEGKRRSEYH